MQRYRREMNGRIRIKASRPHRERLQPQKIAAVLSDDIAYEIVEHVLPSRPERLGRRRCPGRFPTDVGCKLWPVLQDLAQLKALYADRWETFLGNAGVLQFFGNSELSTLDWISKRLGKTTITNASQSNVSYQAAATAGTTGQGWSTATCELMSIGEIARFFGRDDELLRQLIIRPTVPPLVLHRCFYDKHEFFRGKFTPEQAEGTPP